MRKAVQLYKDLLEIYNNIGAEAGMNITYCESMNGDLFSSLVALTFDEADRLEFDDIDDDECLMVDHQGLRFLAKQGYLLPRYLLVADEQESDDRIRRYVCQNKDLILDAVREEAERDYRSRMGRPFRR